MERKFQAYPHPQRIPGSNGLHKEGFLSIEPKILVAIAYSLPRVPVLVPVELKILCLYDHNDFRRSFKAPSTLCLNYALITQEVVAQELVTSRGTWMCLGLCWLASPE